MKPRTLPLLSCTHFFVDSYAAIFGPLVALVRMEPSGIGVFGTLFAAATSFSQLPFGYLADRRGLRLFVVGGLVTAAVFLSSCGLVVGSPALFGALLFLGGLGVAAFHPAAVVLAARALPEQPTVGVSVFITLGMAGFAVGPLLYVLFAQRFGLESTFVLMIPGLLLAPFVLALPGRAALGDAAARRHPPSLERTREFLVAHGPALLPIYVLVVVRSMVQITLSSFVPSLMIERGHSDTVAGLAAMVFIASGALGMLLWGVLAARVDRRLLQLTSILLGVPATLSFLYVEAAPPFVSLSLLAAAGFFVLSTNTMHIVMGQEISPRNAGTISSLVMGFGWGLGSVGPVVVGRLAGLWGLEASLACVCATPLLTLPLTSYLRSRPLAAAAGLATPAIPPLRQSAEGSTP